MCVMCVMGDFFFFFHFSLATDASASLPCLLRSLSLLNSSTPKNTGHIHQEDGTRVAFERIFQEMDRDEHREITLAQFREYAHKHISRAERKQRNARSDAQTHARGTEERRGGAENGGRQPLNMASTIGRVEDGSATASPQPSLPAQAYNISRAPPGGGSAGAAAISPQRIQPLLSSAQIRAHMSPEDRTVANQVEIANLRAQLSDISNSFHRLRESSRGSRDVSEQATSQRALNISAAAPSSSSALESRLLAVEEAMRRNNAHLQASQVARAQYDVNNKNNTAASRAGDEVGRLTMSSLSVPGAGEARHQGGNKNGGGGGGGGGDDGGPAVLTDKLYVRIQMLEEGMRVATTERNLAVTMLKELAGRVSGAVDLVNETITSKMETVAYGEELEARLRALEVQTEVQREDNVESAMRIDDTIVAMSNRLQILEEAIIKEQESTLQQLEQLIKISPTRHRPAKSDRGGAKSSRVKGGRGKDRHRPAEAAAAAASGTASPSTGRHHHHHPAPDVRHARSRVDDHMPARIMRETWAHKHDYVHERGLDRD